MSFWMREKAAYVGGTAATAGRSCLHVMHASNSTLPSGQYWIQPSARDAAFHVYCDMETDGGGVGLPCVGREVLLFND